MNAPNNAMQEAMKLLAYRSRSVHEMTARLQDKGYSDGDISETINRLLEWGYLNDSQFAENWVKSRLRNKPMGPIRLRKELQQKGISKEIIDLVLDREISSDLEFQIARGLAFCSLKGQPSNWEKVAGLLQRRGFSFDIINAVKESLDLDERF